MTVASISGELPMPGVTMYSASKAYLINLFDSLGKEI